MSIKHRLWKVEIQYYEDDDSKGYVANFEDAPYTACIVEGNTLAEVLRELAASVEVMDQWEPSNNQH